MPSLKIHNCLDARFLLEKSELGKLKRGGTPVDKQEKSNTFD